MTIYIYLDMIYIGQPLETFCCTAETKVSLLNLPTVIHAESVENQILV